MSKLTFARSSQTKQRASLKDFPDAKSRREFIQKKIKSNIESIASFSFTEEEVKNRNIENLIGSVEIPLGVAGPLKIKNSRQRRGSPKVAKFKVQSYFIPIATTEGALVASISRGCKVINLAGGAKVLVEEVGMTRGPVFKTRGIEHSKKVLEFLEKNFKKFKEIASSTSHHLTLLKYESSMSGKNLYIRFYFDCSEAMGMNMVTIASEKIAKVLERQTNCECISVAGNFDIDKKAAWLNFISGRGKRVWAEVIIDRESCINNLKVSPEEIVELVYRKNIGSAMAGSLGFNAHFANVIAGIFIATGQDPAHIVEGSLGVTSAEFTKQGGLYFSVYLPALIIGTVGGGTRLPSQRQALTIMGINDEKESVIKFSQVIAAAVLAGELSLLASQAEGSLAKSHKKLGRNGGRVKSDE